MPIKPTPPSPAVSLPVLPAAKPVQFATAPPPIVGAPPRFTKKADLRRKAEGVRHVIAISGKDSLCTAIVQKERRPDIEYEYIFADVKMELPETYRWLEKCEDYLGKKLVRVGKSLEGMIEHYQMIPSHLKRFCTGDCKIEPQIEFFGDDDVVQYIGIRADEVGRIVNSTDSMNPDNVETVYPLVEEGVDLQGVYDRLTAIGMMPPSFFWQRLYDAVCERCSASSRKFIDSLKPWQFAAMFSWRSRSNCSCCFYQSLHEWVGLMEFHPNLFENAMRLEETYGASSPINPEQRRDFTFKFGMRLRDIRDRADFIFQSRVNEVLKAVVEARSAVDAGKLDLLGTTSCGAFCGK